MAKLNSITGVYMGHLLSTRDEDLGPVGVQLESDTAVVVVNGNAEEKAILKSTLNFRGAELVKVIFADAIFDDQRRGP